MAEENRGKQVFVVVATPYGWGDVVLLGAYQTRGEANKLAKEKNRRAREYRYNVRTVPLVDEVARG